jgi:hypothetical protein
VGGTAAGAGNLISGNGGDGIDFLSLVGDNLIEGNLVGTDATGTKAIGNARTGVYFFGGSNNSVGGTTAGAGNLISGNGGDGIEFKNASSTSLATGNLIQGNTIGTNKSGTTKLGNAVGVYLLAAHNTVSGNLISGNRGVGVWIDGTASNTQAGGNVVVGNTIGASKNGSGHLGNGKDGVLVSSSNNQVGGTTAADGNRIAFNGAAGVDVKQGSGNTIRHDSVVGNASLGIVLAGPANHNQAAPLLGQVLVTSAQTTIAGTLTSSAGTTYTLEFFGNPTSLGQGEVYLGQAVVKTDAHGHASFRLKFSVRLAVHETVTATATDPRGDTSRFSAALA